MQKAERSCNSASVKSALPLCVNPVHRHIVVRPTQNDTQTVLHGVPTFEHEIPALADLHQQWKGYMLSLVCYLGPENAL